MIFADRVIQNTGRNELVDETSTLNAVELATELTIAWLGNPNTRAASEDVPAFLKRMHEAVLTLGRPETVSSETAATEFTPATTARRSLASRDHIVSMIDGKPYKTLRRHLATNGFTPAQYRERYKLKADYPMVAPSYSEVRRAMAQKIGLGQKGRAGRKVSPSSEMPPKAPGRRARKAETPAAE
jgi:predicted transcriptional regulator